MPLNNDNAIDYTRHSTSGESLAQRNRNATFEDSLVTLNNQYRGFRSNISDWNVPSFITDKIILENLKCFDFPRDSIGKWMAIPDFVRGTVLFGPGAVWEKFDLILGTIRLYNWTHKNERKINAGKHYAEQKVGF